MKSIAILGGLLCVTMATLATAEGNAKPYNCRTREAWTPEKKAYCAQNDTMEQDLSQQLVGSQWLLEDLGDKGVLDRLQTTLQFEADRLGGFGGCNRYFGSYQIKGKTLNIGPLGSTRKACLPAVMDQENRFFEALSQAEQLRVEGPYLLIESQHLSKPLKFSRVTEKP